MAREGASRQSREFEYVHLLARIVPERASRGVMRSLLCVQCGHDILTANDLSNDDAREPIANHFRRSELTHDLHAKVSEADIVFVRAKDHGLEEQFPDSLLAVLRGS
ncbi:MAG TPA: hypothetical protein VFT12_00550 [Thermoanaerobaculia bacterium]|nr:hypothetical protein [Thermoanaerobaculia bacterium]